MPCLSSFALFQDDKSELPKLLSQVSIIGFQSEKLLIYDDLLVSFPHDKHLSFQVDQIVEDAYYHWIGAIDKHDLTDSAHYFTKEHYAQLTIALNRFLEPILSCPLELMCAFK